MPQKLQKNLVMGAWSTSEQVEEVRGKLHLKGCYKQYNLKRYDTLFKQVDLL